MTTTFRRSLLVAVAVLLTLLPRGGVSEAARPNPYPPAIPLAVSTDQGFYYTNSRAVLTVSGCTPGETVQLLIFPPGVGRGSAVPIAPDQVTTLTVVCGANGSASIVITTPDKVGVYVVVARRPDGATAETRFTVGRVPATGSNTELPVRAALIAIAAGATLVLVARSRRRERPLNPAA